VVYDGILKVYVTDNATRMFHHNQIDEMNRCSSWSHGRHQQNKNVPGRAFWPFFFFSKSTDNMGFNQLQIVFVLFL